jgi:3-hydroxybutyryl-CoA dehydrogenase
MVMKGTITGADKEAAVGLVHGTVALDEIAAADVVIEAATENFDLKVSLLKRVDALVPAETIVASNTSSISITRLGAAISHPDRFIGMHFFNPVPIMELVEVVRGLQTSDAAHDTIEALALELGKTPITVKSGPGFVVNRAQLPRRRRYARPVA